MVAAPIVARVFLSAVSNEVGAACDALADAVPSHDGMTVRVQRRFRRDPADFMLRKTSYRRGNQLLRRFRLVRSGRGRLLERLNEIVERCGRDPLPNHRADPRRLSWRQRAGINSGQPICINPKDVGNSRLTIPRNPPFLTHRARGPVETQQVMANGHGTAR